MDGDDVVAPTKPRRPRPSPEQQPPRRRSSTRVVADEDYVDYQPIDRPVDRTSDWDDSESLDNRDDRSSKRTDDEDTGSNRKRRGNGTNSGVDSGAERSMGFIDDGEDDNSASFN
jgi:hypothetical protein